ncbi:MAG: phage portal protein, partial [Sporomusa sp.]
MLWADQTDEINKKIQLGAASRINDIRFIELEISKFVKSKKYKDMIAGVMYYEGEHDILTRERTAIGENGQPIVIHNLPNNKIVDNQYAKLVDQKVNYLLSKPLTFEVEDEAFSDHLEDIFGWRFMRILRNIGKGSYNGGIAWLFPYCNEQGELCFKRFPAHEVLPFWADTDHTILECAVRKYKVDAYEGDKEVEITKVELYVQDGVYFYELQNGKLIPDQEMPYSPYLKLIEDDTEKPVNWSRIPLIAFRYNSEETPLIKRVKSLQDAINEVLSDFMNNMQEDKRNTILVLKNYDGEDLGEFRRNLATYGAIKVRYDGDVKGGVETLEIEVNAENYKIILDLLKKAITENGRGYDAKDDRMGNNPNQMNIQSMYSDIDLDANGMETEFQAAFEELLWFVRKYLAATGQGDFAGQHVNVIFNRDILINETEAIENCRQSVGILSNETIVGQHPWTTDIKMELERIAEEKKQEYG